MVVCNRSIPDGTYVKSLTADDASFCNNLWNYHYEGSENFIRSLIVLNGGWGLYEDSNDELLSFATINDHFATGILNTVKHARGKKFGEFMAKFLAVKIVEKLNLDPTCYINAFNVPSMKLFEKIGYRKVGPCNWIQVGKPDVKKNC